MAIPVSVPYAFANATTTQNLSYLDSNFNALANGLNGLANGTSQISVTSISATGTANSNTYLRGDGSWATVSASGSTSIANGTSNVSIATSNGSITSYVNGNLAVTTDANLNSTFGGTVAMASSYLRNRIINGAMVIDQRNAGASVVNGSGVVATYPADRWATYGTQATKFTAQQNAGSVTTPANFPKYIGITSSSSYSVLSTDSFYVYQRIEGLNTADLNWGSANALTVTLSFWVRSSLTGTHSGALQNNAQTRSYPFSFVVNSANTWEYKTTTIAGDTSGTWATDNTTGIGLYFNMGSGTSASGTAGTWATATYFGATGAQSVVGTNAATFYVTGVQLEVGSNATPFERRLYGQELALCQRYYQQSRACATDNGAAAATKFYNAPVNFNVAMRTAPTVSYVAITSTNVSSRTALNIFEYGFNHQVVASGGPTLQEVSTAQSTAEL